MMMKSPANSKHEESHYDDYGFDLHEDFSMFLEEAKQHGKESKPKNSSVHPEESRKTGQDKEEKKKGKKSWRNSLVTWWKTNKKSNPRDEATTNNSKPNNASSYGKRHGNVSGPIIHSNSTKLGSNGKKHWSSNSGPLITSLFKPTKVKESEVPYMSLHQPNRSCDLKNYGPLYVVT